MKLVKSLLLGSAAGIVAVGSAVAADLPVRKAAPVDYVQVCSQFGTGYFFIPGTDTCLRISGLLRYEMQMNERGYSVGQSTAAVTIARPDDTTTTVPAGNITRTMGRTRDVTNQFMRADINFDARTATEFGTLQAFARLRMQGNGGAAATVHDAFIDFAGLRVGRFASTFSFGDNPALRNFNFYRSTGPILQAAYTLDAGAFSATIALQEAERLEPSHFYGASARFGASATSAGTAIPSGHANAIDTARDFGYGGRVMPDVIGSLNYSDGGISAQLAGAIHELRASAPISTSAAATNPFAANVRGTIPSTSYGYALMAGVNVQLPMISSGTSLRLVGTYAEGAVHYLGLAQAGNRFTLPVANAFYNTQTGSISKASGWALNAAVSHAWAPNVTQNVFGGYGEYTPPSIARRTFNAGELVAVGPADAQKFKSWELGTNIQWVPVSGLTFGAEVAYRQTTANTRVITGVADGVATTDKTDSAWNATLRVQRTF